MKKVALLYNPVAGFKQKREAVVSAAAALLRRDRAEVLTVATRGPGSAPQQVSELAERGFDTVIACGGDGTVHEVLQGIVPVADRVALGVLPLGTGNALAADLGMRRRPLQAAESLLRATPRNVAVGEVEFRSRDGERSSRYWITCAGAGVDAELMYTIAAQVKNRFGMAAYLGGGLRLAFRHTLAPFIVDSKINGEDDQHVVTNVLASRISDFGGFIGRVTPRAALHRDDMEAILVKAGSRMLYARLAFSVAFGRMLKSRQVELLQSSEIHCRAAQDGELEAAGWKHSRKQSRILVQADGEVLGLLPARVRVAAKRITLLSCKGS